MEKKQKKISKQQALDRLMWICSRGEKCKSDLLKKLKDWNVDEEHWNTLLEQLEKEKFLDEERFTGYYVRDKIRFNKWGRGKISFQLKLKQIPETIVNNALQEFDDEEYYLMLKEEVIRKRLKTSGKNQWDIKSKVLRFAQSRGYEYELVNDIIDNLANEDRDNI